MAELVDASVSKTDVREYVPVRSRPRVQKSSDFFRTLFFIFSTSLYIYVFVASYNQFTMAAIIGRNYEQEELSSFVKSETSELVAILFH